MDTIQPSVNNVLGASFYIPESPLIGNSTLLGATSQKSSNPSGLGIATDSMSSIAPLSIALSPTQSVVYLNSASPNNSSNLSSKSSNNFSLVNQDNFVVGSMPTSLTFVGSNLSDDLYLKLDANGIINFSTDGSKFNALSGIKLASTNIAIALGEGDDTLHIDSSIFNALQSTNSKISFEGGSGKNTIFGAAVDTTWNITGKNSGKVGNLSFQNATDLKAAANNYATFVFSESGSLSGIADGGDGNLGTLIIDGGTYQTSRYVANDAHSGSIFLDDKLIRYDGLAPIIDNTNTADRTFVASAGNDQIVVDKRNTTIDGITADYVFINSLNNTFENVTYKFSPTSKLTIDAGAGDDTITVNWFVSTGASLVIDGKAGNDSVVIAKNLSLNGGGLTVNAENISVATGVTIDTTKAGGSSGAVSLIAADTQSQTATLVPPTTSINATGKAQVNLTGATLKAGNVNISAASDVSGTMSIVPVVAKVTLGSTATVSLTDTRIESTGNVIISGISSVTGNATASGLGSYINTAVDAAVANSTITSSAIANISGQSSISATGTLTVSAKNTISATTTGDAAAAKAGAGIAIANVTATTKAYIDSASNQSISASTIAIKADTDATIDTSAKASPGGSSQNSQTPEAATEGNAVTSGGAIGVAGALAFSKFKNTTEAYLASTNGATLTASTLSIGTTTKNNLSTTADGSAVSSGAVGVGVAVAVNVSDVSNKAYIGGKAVLNVGSTVIEALTPTTNKFIANATSGSGDGSKVGVAGSFALNKLNNSSQALLLSGSVIDAGNGGFRLTSSNKTNADNQATSAQSGSKTLGIGASFSLDLEENKTEALLQDNVNLTKVGTLTLNAAADNVNSNTSKAGAGGAVSVSPTVALTIVNNSTSATIGNAGSSGLLTVGAVDASATQKGVSSTSADGTVTASKVALGAALALSFVNDAVTSTTLRNITSTKGGVSFTALGYSSSSTSGTASAAGSDESKDSNDTSEKQVGDQLSKSDTSSKKADNQAAIKGQVKTSQGNVSVAAGIALNVVTSTANASLADGLTINSAGLFKLSTSNETDASANSNGSAVGSGGASTPKIGVGVAVALNIVKSSNQATIGVANVTATGITLDAKMSAKSIGGDGVSQLDAIAVAGAGATKVGFAGALALTIIGDNPSVAAIKSGATVNANGGDVAITSENTNTTKTYASGVQTAGSSQPKVGVGIAFALDKTDNRSEAVVQDNVNLTNAGKLRLSASSSNSSDTRVETGSAGDIALSPSVAMNLVSHSTIATIGTGGLLTLGSVQATATHSGDTAVKADSSTAGGKAAIGAALALNFVNDTTTATTARNITANTGGVRFSALAYANSTATSKASAGGTSEAKDSSDTADKQVGDQVDANDTSTNAKQRKADASGKAKSQDSSGSSGGLVSVAAGISLNLVTSTANASLGDGLVITTAGKFALTSSNETDASAIADGSTADGSNKVGIGAAVALNIVNAKNQANVGTGAKITAEGVALEAKMSAKSLNGDGTSNLVATATSGGGGGKVGISGSFALNYVTTVTEAVVKSGANVNAGKGDISLIATSLEVDDVTATSKAEGGTVGVGASIGLNLLLSNPVRAEVEDTVTLNGGGSLKISANSSRTVNTTTSAGSASDTVAVSPAVAIAIVSNDTTARLGAGAGTLNLMGSANISAAHAGSVITEGDATAAGEKVAIGAIVAVNVSKDNTIASTLRNFTTNGGNITISSTSAVTSSAKVTASAAGNKQEEDGARNSDDEAAAQSGQKTLPKAKDNADKGNNSAKSSGASGSGVGVAAAVGVNWQIVTNQAIIADNLNISSNGGSVTVSAANQTDASSRAIGTSLSKNATANVSAAVGLNVADVTNLAYVGKNAKINATSANGTVGNIKIEAVTPAQETNEFVVWGFAASGGSSEKSKASVAGSAAINVLTFNNQAIVSDGAQISTLGSVTVAANNPMIVQTLAISGAFSRGTSGGAAGAAISVNILTQNTTATIGANAVVDASESISVTSTSSVTPRAISVDDIKDIVNVISGTAEAVVPTAPPNPTNSVIPPSLDNIPGLDSLMPQLDTVIQPIIDKLTKMLIDGIEKNVIPAALKPYYVKVKADLDDLIKNYNAGTLDTKFFVSKVIGLVEKIAPNIPGVSQIFPQIQVATDIVVNNLRTLINNRIKDPATTIANIQTYISKLSELDVLVAGRQAGLDLGSYITQLNDLGKSVDVNFFQGLLFSELRKNQLKPIEDGIRSVLTGAKNIAPFLSSFFDKLTTQLDDLIAKADPSSALYDPNLDLAGYLTELTDLAKSIAVDFFAEITASITKLVPFTNVAIGAGVGQGQVGIGGSVVVDIFNVNTIASIASGAQINQDINTKAGRNQSVSLSASDTTKINNVAGGLGATTGSAGIGIGVDVEILNRNVLAFIDSASNTATKVKAAGKVSVQTSTSEDIFNLTLSAGVAAKVGVGGTVSYNEITNNVKSGVAGTIAAGGDVSVTALDNSKIFSLAGGLAIAAKLTEGGLKASIGAAVAINKINSTTEALISKANLSTLGALAVNANTNATIQSVTIAGSGSASLGNSAAAFALGASIAINTVNSSVRAAIANGSNVQVGGLKTLSINAKDNSTINAFALGGALAIAAGGGTSVALAIGVSAARNEINGGAEAYVDGSTVTSADSTKDVDLDIQALSNDTISAQSIAVAVAIAKGSTAPSLSGGGAGAGNYIQTKTNAYVNNSTLTKIGKANLNANNTSSIDATVVAISGSISVGSSTGVGASIGAAVANNYIGYKENSDRAPSQVQAYIKNSSVKASGDLTVKAVTDGSIVARVGAGSVAVAASGGTSLSASGSGVVTINKIATLVKAFVDGDGATGIEAKSATLTATDSSKIKADAGAASIAVAAGSTTGGTLSIGVAVASNLISNEVEAFVNNADNAFKTNVGEISLSATSSPTIDAVSVAASIAVGAAGTTGVGISGAGAAAINTILTKTNAYIKDSEVTSAGAVSLSASNTSTINAKIAAVSAAVGGGGTTGVGVSIGAAVANNYIGYDGEFTRLPAEVQAYIQNTAVNAKGALSLSAINGGSINAGVGAGSAAVSGGGTTGVAASGSGVVTLNKIATLVKAFVDGDRTNGIQSKSATLSAKDTSTITADAGAASVAASFGGTAGVSVSIGVSIAQNLISNEVEASIKNAAKGLTTGAVNLTSETNATIKAVSVAASIAAGFGGTAGVSVSGAGAAAVNTILTKTNAFIANSIVSGTTATLSAKNTASIDAKILAASLSAGGGGTAGVGVSIGAAVANNYIGYNGSTRQPAEVQAYILNSSLSGTGALSLSAIDSATINAFVFSGSAAISGGGTAGIAASGSGVFTANKVATLVKAFIDGDGAKGIQATQATLTATDSSTISANAGAASLGIAGSGTASVAGSIGVSLAQNLVTNEVLAYVNNADNSLTTTTGDVSISATTDKASITALSAAASLAAGVSGTAGVGISGAGAESTNLIGTKTNAYIQDSVINSKGAVSLSAKNNAEINANVIAASAALGVSGTAGVGVSIGVAVARNLIGWDVDTTQSFNYTTASGKINIQKGNRVKIAEGARAGDIYEFIGTPAQLDLKTTDYANTSNWKLANLRQTASEVLAYIDPTSIVAGGALTLSAVSSSTIKSSVTAASVAIAGGIGGASLSGAGVGVDNIISTKVQAFIDGDGSLGINATSISLTATDASTITTEAQAASIAATFAIGAAISVGISIAKNEISNNVSAYVQNITAKGLVATTGDIALKAEEKATINAISNAASVAVGLVGISGAGAMALNIIGNSTKTYISNAIGVNAKGAVSLSSADSSTINAFAGQVSGGTTAALGVSLAINTISNQITADLDKANLTTQTGALSLSATSNSQIKSAAAGASLSGMGSVAGALTLNTIRNVIRAGISNNSIVQTQGATNLLATDTSTIDSLAGQVAGALSGGSVGASVATNDILNQVTATIDKSKVTATGGANLTATSLATVNSAAVGAAGAGDFAAGGAIALNKISNTIKAAIANTANVQTQGAIKLTAADNSTINAFSGQLSVAAGASIGASVATNDISNQVIAEINQSTAIAAAGAVNLSATSTGTIKAAAAGGAGAGLFAAGGAVTLNKIANRTGAGIAGTSTVQAQGDITATSTNNATINSFAGQIAGAGGAAIGAAVAINSIGNVTLAYLAGTITSNAGKVSANATNTSTIEGKSAGASISGGVALTGSVSVNNIANQTSAFAGTAKIKSFGNTEIIATDTSTINSMAGQISIGISAAAVGAAVAYNNISNKVEAYVTADPSNPSAINATGNVLVSATGTNTINTIAAGGSASLGVAIAGSVAVNQMSNSVVAYAQNSSITAQGSVGVLANGVNNMTTTGGALSGGLVGIGATIVVNNLANSTKAYADKANISAFGGQTINVLNTDGSGTSAAFKGAAIMATSQDTLSTTIGTAGIGAAGLAVTIAVNTFGSTTEAIVRNSAVTGNNESAYLKAFNNSKVNVTAGNLSAGLAGLGGAIDVTNMNNTTNAYIDSRDPNNLRDDVLTNPLNAPASLSGGKDVAIEATTLKDVTSNTTAAGAGVGSVQGAVSLINMASGLSADAQKASNTTQGTVSTQLNDMDGMGKDSKGNSYISTRKNVLNNLSTNAPVVGGTNAFVIGYASAGDQLTISAVEKAKLNVKADAKSIGAVSVGGAVGIANIQNNASAYTVNSSRLTGGNIAILATGVVDSAQVQTFAGSAGLLGLGAAVSNLSSDNNSKAYLGVNTVINQANNIKVQATSSSGLTSDARNFSLGIAAVGVVLSDAKETGKTRAYLDDGVKIQDAYSDLTVNAVANEAVTSSAQAAAGGILAGNGTIPTAAIAPTVQTSIGNNNQINVRGNVTVKSDVSIDADAGAEGINGGAITVGVSQATVTATPVVNTFVGNNSNIQANNVTIASNLGKAPAANVDPSFDAASAVNSTNDTITFAGASGLTTGDKVLYKNGGGNTIGGLENNRNYNVIVTPTANTIQLGSQFSASSVDVLKNTITFAKEHSFKDNDKVLYKASGTAIGGLTSGTAYYVRIIDSKTIQLSATPYNLDSNQRVVDAIEGAKISDIGSSSITVAADKNGNVINNFQNGNIVSYSKRTALITVNKEPLPDTGGKPSIFNSADSSKDLIANNKITSAGHGFKDGDQVVFNLTGGSAIGGLTSGQTYFVRDAGDNDFKVSATSGGAAIDITSATGGTTAEFKAVGLKETNVKTFTYNTAAALAAVNTVSITGHGFIDGQTVVYTGSGLGLTTGNTYYVVNATVNSLQLANTNGGSVLSLTANAGTQTLTRTVDLLENTNYYIVGANATSFQLAKQAGGAAMTIVKTGLTGTGVNHIFTKQSGIDFTSNGTGATDTLYFDISAGAGNKQTLTTGASVVLPTVGDQVFSAYSQASSGSLIGVNATKSTVTITANVNTGVGDGSSIITKGDVNVLAQSNIALTGSTTSNTYGAIAVGASTIETNVTNNNTTSIGKNAKIQAAGNVTIDGQSAHNVRISGSGSAGSLITFASASATATLNHNTTTNIGDGASITSLRDLNVRSGSNTFSNVSTDASGAGLYADADADSKFYSAGNHQTNIGAAYLEGRSLTVESVVNNLDVTAYARAQGAGLIGNIDGHARVDLNGTQAITNIGSGASLKADDLNLNAVYKNVNSNATANASCDGLGGDTDSETWNYMPLMAKVVTSSNSTLTAFNLNVKSDFENFNRTTNPIQKKAWELRIWTPFGDIVITLDFGSTIKDEQFAPRPVIDFNSKVVRLGRTFNPLLVVNQDGSIGQKSANVTANVTATDITVNNIVNSALGAINFIIPSRSGEMAGNGSFTDRGVYSSVDPAFDTVEIQNYSDRNLIINDIKTINTSGSLASPNYGGVNVNSKTLASSTIAGSNLTNPSLITINNWGVSNLILNGVIDNPHDRTVIYSNGAIISQNTNQQIITRDLNLTAKGTDIGSTGQLIKAKLVRGYATTTAAVPTNVSGVTTNVGVNVAAQGSINLNLTTQRLDANPITVTVNQISATTGAVNLKIDSTTDKNNAAIASTYRFASASPSAVINAGTTITLNAGTTNTAIEGSLRSQTGGLIDVVSGSSLTLTSSGVLNVKRLNGSAIALAGGNVSFVSGATVNAAQDLTINQTGNLAIDAAATINAGNNVTITNQGTLSSTTSVNGWIYAKSLSIFGNSNNDTINIQRIATPTYVYTGAGNDTVNVGSKQPSGNGTLSGILSKLTIDGASATDTLNLDDTGNTTNATGIITDSAITGFGMITGSIGYSNFEILNLNLGIGNNNVTVNSTHGGTTNINGNIGNDTFTVNSIGGSTNIDGAGGTNQLSTSLTLAPAKGTAKALFFTGGTTKTITTPKTNLNSLTSISGTSTTSSGSSSGSISSRLASLVGI